MRSEIHDDVFGLLKKDDDFYYWRSTVQFSPAEVVEFVLNVEEMAMDVEEISSEELTTAIEGAHKIYHQLQEKESTFRLALADEYLLLYNGDWRDREPAIDVEAFLGHMTLNSIAITESGESNLSYTVGDLFTDHAINVRVTPEMQIRDSGLDG